ncbi:FAD-dependent oxidoreductase [Texcoconibacillus texcoconensis]|uniref:FAD dependent oxidoreductase n=1 Tax=Texcoconibacillus texcoconensis TaxID=1095777 RepID=A0A840QR56_9BACI|nr:FAD-dependent oxidoreductase [Texcoconibacillus texcoconensis]MBB5173777.1 hypothetical protein [Texcoconibacillus texcoconensis]
MNKKLFMVLVPLVLIVMAVNVFFFSGDDEITQNEEETSDTYQPPEENPDIEQEYDVIVLGGEPEGVSAAVSAARNGAETLLVERRDGLGGLMTYGMLNYIDMVYGIDGEHAIGGIFEEWHHMVGRDDAFDIDVGKQAFLELVEEEENLTLLLETDINDAVVEDEQTVTGVTLENEDGEQTIYGQRFVDATQDADFAVMAGAPYFVGGADINLEDRRQAVTLMIHLRNVDWDGVRQTAEEEIFDKAGVTETVAWGFNDLHYEYETVEEDTRLRGLNLVRIAEEGQEEEFFINALQLFGVDGLDEAEVEEAIEKGIRETDRIVEYLREEFPGFEEAEVIDYPEELYIRETRHVYSEYMLPMSDVWAHADHWDSIGYGGYPVDVQATSVNDFGYVLSDPEQFAIPFRSLVPLEVENISVVSRSAGYSSLASGSARIIPTGMAAGEAGGLAAQLAIENDMTFRELSQDEELIEELRQRLADQGAFVEHFDISYPYENKWFDESIQFLIDYGLVVAGYDNDLRVEEPLSTTHFANLLSNGLARMNEDAYHEFHEAIRSPFNDSEFAEGVFTRDEMAEYIISIFEDTSIDDEPWAQALDLNLIDEEVYHRIPEDDELVRKEGHYIAAQILKNYQ